MTKYRVLVDTVQGRDLVGNAWENRYYTAVVRECETLAEAEAEVARMSGVNPQQRNPRIQTID